MKPLDLWKDTLEDTYLPHVVVKTILLYFVTEYDTTLLHTARTHTVETSSESVSSTTVITPGMAA